MKLVFLWLGYLDSNQSIEGSEPTALPLGHTPKKHSHHNTFLDK